MRLIWVLCFMEITGASLAQITSEDLRYGGKEKTELLGYGDVSFEWNMPGPVQVALNEGINYLKEERPNLSIPNLSEAIKLDSTLWVAYYYRGVCHKLVNHLTGAAADMKKAAELSQGNDLAVLEQGKVAQLRQDLRAANKFYDELVSRPSSKVMGSFMKAGIHLQAGELSRARKAYSSCLRLDSSFVDPAIRLGWIMMTEKNSGAAGLPYFELALKKEPANRQALFYRAVAKFTDDPKTSIDDWDRLIDLDPENMRLRMVRGLVYILAEDYERAFPDLHKVIQSTRESEDHFQGKQTLTDKRLDIQYAGYYVILHIYNFPDEDATQFRKAYCLLMGGQYDKSLESLQAVSKHEKSPLWLFLGALVNEHAGNHNAAFKLYDRALQADRDIYDAHKKRGVYFTELGRWQDAEGDFNEMLRINPESLVAHKFKGITRYHQADYDGAIREFSLYLAKDSTDAEIRGFRGMAYQQGGDILKAAADLLESGNMSAIEPETLGEALKKKLTDGDTIGFFAEIDHLDRLSPGIFYIHQLKLDILLHQKNWETILKIIDPYIKADAAFSSGSDYAYLLVVKGIALSKFGNEKVAIRMFDDALQYDDSNGRAYLERGKVRLKQQKVKEAKADLKQAARLNEREAQALLETL